MTKVLEEEFDLPPIPGRENKPIKAVADDPALAYGREKEKPIETRRAEMYEGSDLPDANPPDPDAAPPDYRVVPSNEEVAAAIANARKLAKAIPEVQGIENHEDRMNEISAKAEQTFEDLLELSMTVEAQNTGPIAGVARQFLEQSYKAQESILNAKLKLIDAMQANQRLTNEADKTAQRREAEANRKAEADRAFEAGITAVKPGTAAGTTKPAGSTEDASAVRVHSGTARSELMANLIASSKAQNDASNAAPLNNATSTDAGDD